MRITKEQSQENRARVIDGAARLFRERGFAGVGVADLMRAAGLTHGGFYNHFDSKDELEAEACKQALARSSAKLEAVARKEGPDERAEAMAAYMRSYVSKNARDAAAPSCPMAAFAGEMPRQSARIAAAYAEGLRAYLAMFAKAQGASRPQALARFSMLAGALILARSVAGADGALSDEILAAANVSLDADEDLNAVD